MHILPDFHGNRSPLADPEMKGSMVGLNLEASKENLALIYLATIQALAYGTKAIVDRLKSKGHRIDQVAICGGLSQSPLYIQTTSDVLNVPVVKPHQSQSVLLGSAILAFAAAENVALVDAVEKMQGSGLTYQPDLSIQAFHRKKYQVFAAMTEDQLKYRTMMR